MFGNLIETAAEATGLAHVADGDLSLVNFILTSIFIILLILQHVTFEIFVYRIRGQ